MEIRLANVKDMQALWNYSGSNTYQYFSEGLEGGMISFIAAYDNEKIVGELYVFWDSEDKDEADGQDRAYLCALRVVEDYQGQGIASKLKEKALQLIKERNYKEVSIAADYDDLESLTAIYKAWGFIDKIKDTNIDYHYICKDGKPLVYEHKIPLWLKKL